MDNFEDDTSTSHTLQEGSSIAPSSPVMPPSSSTLADAFERRLRQQREQQQQERARESYHAWDENHEKRQEFRRLIDPGILRPNPRHIALEALYTLQKLSDNILEHPDEPKYQRFKPTNPKIKATLVDPKGTLEYAVALGFRPEVQNFQPYYVWHKRRMNELQVGNAILKEMLELETSKEERLAQAKKEEKAIAEAAKAKVKQAFMDDRKSKAMQDRRERELRNIHEAATRRTSLSPPSSPATRMMPGSGHTLHESSSYQDDD